MADIVLLTFNARYHHSSFGLRYLKANLGELAERCVIVECDLEKRPADVVEQVLKLRPKIVGLGVYIWNNHQSQEFARLLKVLRPEIHLVIGGPEVSYELETQPLAGVADHIICGEGDLAFAVVCRQLLAGQGVPKIIRAKAPDLGQVALPYDLYDEADLQHRTLYVEASRGCPFHCEFCLSSIGENVRRFPLEAFLPQMQRLLDRCGRHFKFVDRTFNANTQQACEILRFFLERMRPGMFLHFEMIPDHLPEAVAQLLQKFPAGTLQLEIGIQTFDAQVAERIGRQQDNTLVEKNLRWLRENTHAHIHADLIAGLPGESLESFAAGFDRLLGFAPHEIQLGILKLLHGAPISRHTEAFQMVYAPEAPYEILQNNLLDFATVQRLKRMARFWDVYANSGNFRSSLPLLWRKGSPFYAFLALADDVYQATGKTHQISLPRQFELLHHHLRDVAAADATEIGITLAEDYLRPGRKDLPGFLESFAREVKPQSKSATPLPRQGRHG